MEETYAQLREEGFDRVSDNSSGGWAALYRMMVTQALQLAGHDHEEDRIIFLLDLYGQGPEVREVVRLVLDTPHGLRCFLADKGGYTGCLTESNLQDYLIFCGTSPYRAQKIMDKLKNFLNSRL